MAQLLQIHQQYECLEQQKPCVNVYGLWMVKLERSCCINEMPGKKAAKMKTVKVDCVLILCVLILETLIISLKLIFT